jgi:hypothetical protein
MKITALLILTFLLTQVGYCQSDFVYFEYNKQKFISIELSNLVTALNNSLNNWETGLKKNGFKETNAENDIHFFMKGEMGSIFQATSKDSINGVVSINWYDFTNKKSLMGKIEAIYKLNSFYFIKGSAGREWNRKIYFSDLKTEINKVPFNYFSSKINNVWFIDFGINFRISKNKKNPINEDEILDFSDKLFVVNLIKPTILS